MKAMIEAEKAKCDVINMSLGNDAPWSEQPHAAFAQKLASQGISGNNIDLEYRNNELKDLSIISCGFQW